MSMPQERRLFDDVARALASSLPRRRVFGLIGSAVAGAALATVGFETRAEAQERRCGDVTVYRYTMHGRTEHVFLNSEQCTGASEGGACTTRGGRPGICVGVHPSEHQPGRTTCRCDAV